MERSNNNIGALFPNSKGEDPSRPDFRGSININGATYSLSGWERLAKKTGKRYIRLEVDPSPEANSQINSKALEGSKDIL
jgi:uncharacterized protein (DUF736 family)